VFLAEDLTLQRPVALKVMCLLPGDDLLSGWERFLREARALAAIKHPNLVAVYQGGQDAGTIYLAMELLEGETLEARIRREGPFDASEVLWIAEQIATGLAAIHERGLIHRDIKPANIWLMSAASQDTESMTEDEPERPAVAQVKILDFGLVREVNADTQLTEAGVVVGTPAYMSPEQIRGRPLDGRTDLFSFGCVLYAMCTGRAPFDASTPLAQAAALAADEPERVRKLNPEIPPRLSKLITELLAKDPEDRPSSATEVIERLRTVNREDEPPPAKSRPPFAWRHAVKFVAGIWVVLAVLVAVALTRNLRPRDQGQAAVEPPPASPAPPPKAPATPPTAEVMVYLMDLPKLDERTFPPPDAPPPPGVDGTVTVNGVRSPHGIFMHGAPAFKPVAFARYSLDKKYSRFTTDVGMNDMANPWSGLVFVVYGDGKELWKSRDIWPGKGTDRCAVDVQNVTALTLEVRTLGTEQGAHGAWIEPRFTK